MSELARLGLLDPRLRKADPNAIPGKQYYYGNMYEGPAIQPTPRNQVLGPLADAADYTIPKAISSVPDLLNEMSYGEMPYTGTGLTTTVDPRVADFADFMPGKAALTGVGVVGSTIGKKAFKPLTKSDAIKEVTKKGYDPRIAQGFNKVTGAGGEPRLEDLMKLDEVNAIVQPYKQVPQDKRILTLQDLEGRPFITSMSDRTRADGLITEIKGVKLKKPVAMLGGQGHMYLNDGQVWASELEVIKKHQALADKLYKETGKTPVLLPNRMGPSGSDFSQNTGEVMLAYGDANMTQSVKKELDSDLKKIIPGWKGISDPNSWAQYGSSNKKVRNEVLFTLDQYRNKGGLSIPEARVAITEPAQLNAADSGLMYVGEIDPTRKIITDSGHAVYSGGLPGNPVGLLNEDRRVYEILQKEAGIVKPPAKNPNTKLYTETPNPYMYEYLNMNPRNPSTAANRSLQMMPYGGLLTEDILRKIYK